MKPSESAIAPYTIELSSCDCRLKMSDLYENVEFAALTRRIIST